MWDYFAWQLAEQPAAELRREAQAQRLAALIRRADGRGPRPLHRRSAGRPSVARLAGSGRRPAALLA